MCSTEIVPSFEKYCIFKNIPSQFHGNCTGKARATKTTVSEKLDVELKHPSAKHCGMLSHLNSNPV